MYRYYAKYPDEYQRAGINQKGEESATAPEVTAKNPVNNTPATWNLGEYTGLSHYHTGDIYKDEQGNRWFVASMSGRLTEEGSTKEVSPYSELISFEGLTVSDDKTRFTNLNNLEQTIRGA